MEFSCDTFKCKELDDSDEIEELADTKTAADDGKDKDFGLKKTFEDVFEGDQLICIKGNLRAFLKQNKKIRKL